MKEYVISYTIDTNNYFEAIVKAPTYTSALVEFMLAYPNCIYTMVTEV